MTEEYEFYTPFKMLFISLSLGAQSTSNFTHSYNSLPNSSCCSSGVPRNQVSLCLPLMRLRQGQWRLRASAHRRPPTRATPGSAVRACACTLGLNPPGARAVPTCLGAVWTQAGEWPISHAGRVDCSNLRANKQLVC